MHKSWHETIANKCNNERSICWRFSWINVCSVCHHTKVSARSNLLIAFMNLQRVTWLALSISLLASSQPQHLLYHPELVPAPFGKLLLNGPSPSYTNNVLKPDYVFPGTREWRETVIDLSYVRVNYQHIRARETTLLLAFPADAYQVSIWRKIEPPSFRHSLTPSKCYSQAKIDLRSNNGNQIKPLLFQTNLLHFFLSKIF